MGDGDHCLAFHELVEAGLDGHFHLGVEGAGGLVEQQNRRIFQHDSGDGDALALAAREFHSTLAHMGIEPLAPLGIGQCGNETVGLRSLCCGHHLCIAGIGQAVGDVVAHRAVQ